MYKLNYKNLLLVILLSALLTSLNAYALEQRTAPEVLIKHASYLDIGRTPDGQRIVLMKVEKTKYADRIESTDNNPSWYKLPIPGNMYSAALDPQAQTITLKAVGKTVKQRVRSRLVWDWSWESKQICIPWWRGGSRCTTTQMPKWASHFIPAYETVHKYKDQEITLTLAEQVSAMGDMSLSVTREQSAPEQMLITSQFQPVANAKSYQQECTSADGHTLSASTTAFNQSSVQVAVEHYGRRYRCTVSATIQSPRDIFRAFVRDSHQFADQAIVVVEGLSKIVDALFDSPIFDVPDNIFDELVNELPSYLRDASEVSWVSAEQVIDVPLQHRYAFNLEDNQEHYAYHAYPTQASFEEALAEAQFCHSAWCLDLGNGETLVLYGDYNLPIEQDDQDTHTYTLYLANFDDDQTTPQVLHQISSSKQLAKMTPLDAQLMPNTNLYRVLLSYRDKNVADMVHITEDLEQREQGWLSTTYYATSTHIVSTDSNDKILAMPVIDLEADLGQTFLATYNPQTELLSVQGYNHHGDLIESNHISGDVGQLALPLERLWIDHHDTAQDIAQDTTENTPLRSLNIVDNRGTYKRLTGAENVLYTSGLIDDATSKPLSQLTHNGDQCKNYYLDKVEDETRFVAYPDCMLADHAYISVNNQKTTYVSSHNNSHNHQLACYQDNDAAGEDATTEKVHCHRHHPIVEKYLAPNLDFEQIQGNRFTVDQSKFKRLESSLVKSSHAIRVTNKSTGDKLMIGYNKNSYHTEFPRNPFHSQFNIYSNEIILQRYNNYYINDHLTDSQKQKALSIVNNAYRYQHPYYSISLSFGSPRDFERELGREGDELGSAIDRPDDFQKVRALSRDDIDNRKFFTILMEGINTYNYNINYSAYQHVMRNGLTIYKPKEILSPGEIGFYKISLLLGTPFDYIPNTYPMDYYVSMDKYVKLAIDQSMPNGYSRTLPPTDMALNINDNKILILLRGKDPKILEKQVDAEGVVNYRLTVAMDNYTTPPYIIAPINSNNFTMADNLFNSQQDPHSSSALDDEKLEAIETLYNFRTMLDSNGRQLVVNNDVEETYTVQWLRNNVEIPLTTIEPDHSLYAKTVELFSSDYSTSEASANYAEDLTNHIFNQVLAQLPEPDYQQTERNQLQPNQALIRYNREMERVDLEFNGHKNYYFFPDSSIDSNVYIYNPRYIDSRYLMEQALTDKERFVYYDFFRRLQSDSQPMIVTFMNRKNISQVWMHNPLIFLQHDDAGQNARILNVGNANSINNLIRSSDSGIISEAAAEESENGTTCRGTVPGFSHQKAMQERLFIASQPPVAVVGCFSIKIKPSTDSLVYTFHKWDAQPDPVLIEEMVGHNPPIISWGIDCDFHDPTVNIVSFNGQNHTCIYQNGSERLITVFLVSNYNIFDYSDINDKTITLSFENAFQNDSVHQLRSFLGNLPYGNKLRGYSHKSMFRYAAGLRRIELNVEHSTNLSYMFADAVNFNQNLSSFDTSQVRDMSHMFANARAFNQPLPETFDTGEVTDMSYMFAGAVAFNQVLPSRFDTGKVTNMSYMFNDARAFNQYLPLHFDTGKVTDMSHMFEGARAFNKLLPSRFDTSKVTNMSYMFSGAHAFNQVLPSKFDTREVNNMSYMFAGAHAFNQVMPPHFDTSKVTDMSHMFEGAHAFNQFLPPKFDTGKVTNMSHMFEGARAFNKPLPARFKTGKVTDMSYMFANAVTFNRNLSYFDTSQVRDMSHMFANARAFNQPLPETFETGEVTDMSYMFANAITFNRNLSSFDTSQVEKITYMFNGARSFNQDIRTWDLTNVTDINSLDDRRGWNLRSPMSPEYTPALFRDIQHQGDPDSDPNDPSSSNSSPVDQPQPSQDDDQIQS